MDQNAFDIDHDLDLDLDHDLDRDADLAAVCPASPAPARHPVATLTNSPGCTPARRARRGPHEPRPVMRTVRVDAWSVPASANWSRPSRALRKVAIRAVESDAVELE